MFLLEFITKENVTLAVAVFGAVGSLITMIKNSREKRRNVKINVISYTSAKDKNVFLAVFENRSILPVSITGISLLLNGKEYACPFKPVVISEEIKHSGIQNLSVKKNYSFELPIVLNGLESVQGHLAFSDCQDILTESEKLVTFRVDANRGNPFLLKAQLRNWVPPERFF